MEGSDLIGLKKGPSGSSIYKDFGRTDFDNQAFDECLDESTLEQPEFTIESVGDLIKGKLHICYCIVIFYFKRGKKIVALSSLK